MTRLHAVRIAGASAAGMAAVLFALLAWAIGSGAIAGFDEAIRSGVHAFASEVATWLAHGFSFIGSAPIWFSITVAAIAIFWQLGWRRAAVDLAIVMAGAIVLGNLFKEMFARVRPEVYFGAAPPTFSFPSGHALYAACLYAALACLIADRISEPARRAALWIGGVLLIGAIGLSRIYLGVHYPSDVIGGYLVAVFWIGLVTAVRANDKR